MTDPFEIIEVEVNKGMRVASSGEIAHVILDALKAAGFAVVSIEPTEAMTKVGAREITERVEYNKYNGEAAGFVWRAMLAASQEPESHE